MLLRKIKLFFPDENIENLYSEYNARAFYSREDSEGGDAA